MNFDCEPGTQLRRDGGYGQSADGDPVRAPIGRLAASRIDGTNRGLPQWVPWRGRPLGRVATFVGNSERQEALKRYIERVLLLHGSDDLDARHRIVHPLRCTVFVPQWTDHSPTVSRQRVQHSCVDHPDPSVQI